MTEMQAVAMSKARAAELLRTEPEDLVLIARLWNAYFGDTLCDETDVANMMALVDIANIKMRRLQ